MQEKRIQAKLGSLEGSLSSLAFTYHTASAFRQGMQDQTLATTWSCRYLQYLF